MNSLPAIGVDAESPARAPGLEVHAHAIERHALAGAVTADRSIAPSTSVMPSSIACSDFLALRGHLRFALEREQVTSWPARRALRATSIAALPPPITARRLPSAGGAPAFALREVGRRRP